MLIFGAGEVAHLLKALVPAIQKVPTSIPRTHTYNHHPSMVDILGVHMNIQAEHSYIVKIPKRKKNQLLILEQSF